MWLCQCIQVLYTYMGTARFVFDGLVLWVLVSIGQGVPVGTPLPLLLQVMAVITSDETVQSTGAVLLPAVMLNTVANIAVDVAESAIALAAIS